MKNNIKLNNHIKYLNNYIKYARSQYFDWLGKLATILGIVAILPICECFSKIIVIACFAFAFIIPFLKSFIKSEFKLKTIGKSNITFKFGDLFDEECFVVTTNCYFDVNPSGEYISEDSLLGSFVEKFFHNNVSQLESLINTELAKKCNGNNIDKFDYGTSIKINYNGKLIYFLAFTDRIKTDQPNNFYESTMQTFLTTIRNENHGKIISIPLIGDNNNLSESGFSSSEITFKSLMAMINNFEIVNQKSELKIKIVALPKKRPELINVVKSYSK